MTPESGFLFRALPDLDGVSGRVAPDGLMNVVLPNQMLPSQHLEDRIVAAYPTMFYSQLSEARMERAPWVINYCADADAFETALKGLSLLQSKTGTPVFNHPDAVLRSRRDTAAGLLEGVKNLIVPKCVRFDPANPDDFDRVFQENGFDYPVLVRPAASQGGRGLTRVDNPTQWDLVHRMAWQGVPLYMTQFFDFSGDDGVYRKTRINVAGGRVVIRHVFFSDAWNIHASLRTPEKADRELPLVQRKDWTALEDIALEIHTRIGMDNIGLDLGVIDDETFVFFEANAAMTTFDPKVVPDYRREEYMEVVNRVDAALLASLADFGVHVP